MKGIPYPPVFRDWFEPERRIATGTGPAGPYVEMYMGASTWKRVELTEDTAARAAAALLFCAGYESLAKTVIDGLDQILCERCGGTGTIEEIQVDDVGYDTGAWIKVPCSMCQSADTQVASTASAE